MVEQMAVAAPASQVIGLAGTRLRSSPSHNWNPSFSFPVQPAIFHLHCYRTSYRGLPRLSTTNHAKSTGPSVADELGDIDEAFSYNDDLIGEEYESDEDEDTESSMDLLFRFLQSMFRKVSKRVRKASRSVLPAVIPPQLLSFAVDGVLLLATLSILKAFLEVACTIGGTVFVVILLLRAIWAATAYFQSNGNSFNQTGSSYGRSQPVS